MLWRRCWTTPGLCRPSKYVREVYPDTYKAHGQWCGPEWEAAGTLAQKMDDAVEKMLDDAGAVSAFPARPENTHERNKLVAKVRKALAKMVADATTESIS